MFIIKAQKPKANSGKATFGDWGIETRFISKSVKPGNDFYTYVNEGWLKSSPIPAGTSGFNSFSEAKDKINLRISDMIREGAKTGH
jgi:endothelin-converting enzyme/putative endopeptidase